MHPLWWMIRARIAVLLVGLLGASCAVQRSAVLLRDTELPLQQQGKPVTATRSDVATKATLQKAYGKLPLSFEANQGQSEEKVKFLSRGHGYTLFLTSSQIRR